MLLKIIHGQNEWLLLNGDAHFIHLKVIIKEKCPNWPKGATLDLCDVETGVLMGMHALEPWDMATSCFRNVKTHLKIFVPVALKIERGVLAVVEPMLDRFAEQFPETKAMLNSLINTKIRVTSSGRHPSLISSTPGKDSKQKFKATKRSKERKSAKK